MLTTIQELEKDIEQFHKNVKESNELMKILEALASLTKEQTDKFDVRTSALYDEVNKLPNEVKSVFSDKVEEFFKSLQVEHESYQLAVKALLDRYIEQVTSSETEIKKVPEAISIQMSEAQQKYINELNEVEKLYAQKLEHNLNLETEKIIAAADDIKKLPEILEHQLQQERLRYLEGLNAIQTRFSEDLAKTSEEMSAKLNVFTESVHKTPEILQEISLRQYSEFIKEFKEISNSRHNQLLETENHIIALSKQLEMKYNEFVLKLESTNVDQLYKYCQDMNKSMNTKLAMIIGGVVASIVVSIVSIFVF